MMHLFANHLKRNPAIAYSVMRRVAPVFRDPVHDLWKLFDFDSVKRALTDHDTFSSRAAPPGDKPLEWLIFQDPPQHRKLRAIIMRIFTPRSIAALEPRIARLTQELLDAALPRGDLDLVTDFAEPLPLSVIAELLGIETADRRRLNQWSTSILNLSNAVAGGETAARAIRDYAVAREEMRDYLKVVLAERRVTAAGLGDMRLYDLRHSMATLMLENGEHPKVASERLGHSTVRITLDVYSHVNPTMQREATNRLSAVLYEAMEEPS